MGTLRKNPGAIVRSYMDRNAHPDIARAFRSSAPPGHEDMEGTPSFDDLLTHQGMRAAISSSGDGLELVRGLTALRGVTVSVSVSLVDKDKNVVAECSWHAGRGIEFRGGMRRD